MLVIPGHCQTAGEPRLVFRAYATEEVMSEQHTELLKKARERLVEDRRDLAKTIAAPFERDRVNRREFITLLGGGAAAWPVLTRAQETIPRIGFLPLGSSSNRYDLSYVEAFRQGLVDNGLIDGKNVVVDLVWVANEPEYDQAVVELIRRGAKIRLPVQNPVKFIVGVNLKTARSLGVTVSSNLLALATEVIE
jgi:hypothetical protein